MTMKRQTQFLDDAEIRNRKRDTKMEASALNVLKSRIQSVSKIIEIVPLMFYYGYI